MRRTAVVVATLVAAVPALAGCGSDAGTSPSGDRGDASTIVDIVVQNGTVSPNGTRVKAEAGSPITLRITSDTPGELHVHSSPEQEIEFGRGTTTRRLTIDEPGIVDVEDHALEQVIVQLQVS